ncbi:MAG: hypothetical protein P1R58_07360 [bacterium]|nr:hypothetical protein [bacterium]
MNARSFITYLRQYAVHLDRKKAKPGETGNNKSQIFKARLNKKENSASGETSTKH